VTCFVNLLLFVEKLSNASNDIGAKIIQFQYLRSELLFTSKVYNHTELMVSKSQENSNQFPIGTLVYYGPDDQTVTKIVAGVLASQDGELLRKTWNGEGIAQNPAVIAEVGKFFQSNKVNKVLMTGSIAGCPHEEGIDYPIGDECPYCPFWIAKKHQQGEY
jgi:hypothetical protein